MAPEQEISLLRDALDHIARIANASRQQTRRLDWISSRAREALRGVEWNREYLPEPKKASQLLQHRAISPLRFVSFPYGLLSEQGAAAAHGGRAHLSGLLECLASLSAYQLCSWRFCWPWARFSSSHARVGSGPSTQATTLRISRHGCLLAFSEECRSYWE
jgi:hypothetical protein